MHAVPRQLYPKHEMCARARGNPTSGLASRQRARTECMLGRSSACGSTPQPGLRPCQKTSYAAYAICRGGGLPQRRQTQYDNGGRADMCAYVKPYATWPMLTDMRSHVGPMK